jgi:predicted HicB family RNase H-like nuclease
MPETSKSLAPEIASNSPKEDGAELSSFFHAKISKETKAKWNAAARRSGLKLVQWVVDTLNNAADGQTKDTEKQ